MNGHYCDNCGNHLNDEDYTGYGSWSYTCPECGFRYSHSSEQPVGEQVRQFNVGVCNCTMHPSKATIHSTDCPAVQPSGKGEA